MKIKDLIKGIFPQQAPRRTKLWAITLNELGFDKILFPIIIRDGDDLDIVYRLQDFAIDPDYFYHEYDNKMDLIDSNGEVWSWKYDNVNKTNLPGSKKQSMTLDELKGILNHHFENTKNRNSTKKMINDSSTIRELIEVVADRL